MTLLLAQCWQTSNARGGILSCTPDGLWGLEHSLFAAEKDVLHSKGIRIGYPLTTGCILVGWYIASPVAHLSFWVLPAHYMRAVEVHLSSGALHKRP